MIHILVTGDNRNPALFLSQIDLWNLISKEMGILIEISYAWPYANNKPEVKSALLDKNIKIVPFDPLPNNEPTWKHQANSFKQLLKNVSNESFVLKTRPDVYLSPNLISWLFASIQSWPKSKNPNLQFKIWVPWAHTFYPFLFDDKSFAGKAEDLRLLTKEDGGKWRRLYADMGKEAHVRRWLPLFKNFGDNNQFVVWFENFSPSNQIKSNLLNRISKISLGERIYRRFSSLRFDKFLTSHEIHAHYIQYLECVDDSFYFFETHGSCKNAFIDKWGPYVDAFAKEDMSLEFFKQRNYPWVLYSENNVPPKLESFITLTNLGDKSNVNDFRDENRDFLRLLRIFNLAYIFGIRQKSKLRTMAYFFGAELVLKRVIQEKEAFHP
jgi:hypothetical protein